jgi:hypothetical protein
MLQYATMGKNPCVALTLPMMPNKQQKRVNLMLQHTFSATTQCCTPMLYATLEQTVQQWVFSSRV